eukprot:CAMPEP_0195011780 /NCGR_PEP_ID=MMETSP0326_2-20130528/11275_1 /TAXON_ID=2866 ORGANISM="Crypthecodinium cohnii, Strain Seligo" /NCGR_SAMPLE_ID=MMETSP0326_2 /ASSEMBLY_ACC=CAM_ASM_000348 /LENGTH=47 /DNA_ID= /DNA_START= /DNA_END= /DNA_ORIENTATION=
MSISGYKSCSASTHTHARGPEVVAPDTTTPELLLVEVNSNGGNSDVM